MLVNENGKLLEAEGVQRDPSTNSALGEGARDSSLSEQINEWRSGSFEPGTEHVRSRIEGTFNHGEGQSPSRTHHSLPNNVPPSSNEGSEAPPAYTDSPSPSTRGPSSPRRAAPLGPTGGLRPTNYICISQQYTGLKEQYTVDPSLVIPPALLPALPEGESEHQRKNFKATNAHASLHVSLRLQEAASSAGARATDDKRRLAMRGGHDNEPITIELGNSNSSITARITDALPTPRRKLAIVATTSYAKITIYLPRSFTGPLTAGAGGYVSVAFSETIQPYVTMFSERDYFIGELSEYSAALGVESDSRAEQETAADGSQSGRLMDTVELRTSHSKILVKWEDEWEGDKDAPGPVTTLFRLLGF